MTERTRGWLRSIARYIGLVLPALLVLSCSEEPTDQNSLTPPVDLPAPTIRDTTIEAVHDSTFKHYISMDGISNLVGSAQGYTAITVLQFPPSTLTPRADTVNVVSAQLRLRLSYRMGDPTGPFSFDVYRVLRSWGPGTLTWDSVATGFYDASTKHGSFSQTLTSDSGYVTVDLDTAMVRQWISNAATVDQKYGIVLVPNPSSSVRGFSQFTVGDSTSYYPTLTIIATNVSGTTRDTATYNSGYGTFVGNVDLPNDPNILYVQAGIVYQTRLLFDISFIPRGTTINSAILTLDLAPASTRLNSYTTDTTLLAHVDLSDDPSAIEGFSALIRPTSSAFTSMSGDISHAVQSWLRGPNYGIVLRNSSPAETSRLDSYGIYGVRVPTTAVRPRIRITYSLGKN